MRRFEYVGGGSEKFWEIDVAGASVTVRFGRIGTAGQTQVKDLGTDQAAGAHVAKLIAEKQRKGYVECGSAPAAAAAKVLTPPEPDEDTWTVPTTWWRKVVPFRGRGPSRSQKADVDRAQLAALRTETAEAVARVLEHPGSDADLVRHARLALDDAEGTPLGAAVMAALLVGSTSSSGGRWLPAIADEWVATHDIAFAAEAGALVAGVRVGNPRCDFGAHRDNVVTVAGADGLWASQIEPLLTHLRVVLAGADDREYGDAVARLGSHREGEVAVRATTSYLAPTEQHWVDLDIRSRGLNAATRTILLASVTTAKQANAVIKRCRGWHVWHPELVYSMAAHIGPDVAPILADLFDFTSGDLRKRAATMLGELPSDEAFRLLLDRADHRHVQRVVMEAMGRFPRRAMRILADVATGSSPQAATAGALLGRSAPAVMPAPDATSGGLPTASDDQLPALLVTPPWAPGQARPGPVVVAGIGAATPIELLWQPGEQEAWAAGDSGYGGMPARSDWDREVQRAVEGREYRMAGVFVRAPAELVRPHLAHAVFPYTSDDDPALQVILGRFGEEAAGFVVRSVLGRPSGVGQCLLPLAGGGIAARMAERYATSETDRPVALAWFDRHPAATARDLIPSALGKPGRCRSYAETALRVLDRRGHGASVRTAAAAYGPAAAEGVEAVLNVDPLELLPARIPARPAWLGPAHLPPVLLSDRMAALPASAVGHICTMLAMSEPGRVYAGVDVVREAVDPASLAEMAWALFERWGAAGYPSAQSWVLHGLGLVGNDGTVRRLAPLIQAWPGEAAHARAVAGLQVLATIGTDAALMHLHAIAEKARFNGLKTAALAKMEEVADGLGLTAEQLGDRLVPDFGLDPDGSLVLDYGERHFRVGFDEQLQPFVADADGSRRRALPKPGPKDDPSLAPAAYARFAGLKRDVRTVATDQIRRLERAMVTGRRWTAAEHRALFIEHPLVRHLARRLVWATFDDDDQPTGFFRIAEDQTLAGPTDAELTLADDAVVGVAHPIHLGETLGVWSDVFADYEVLQPFPQLGREVLPLTAAERRSRVLRRFTGLKVPTGKVLGLAHRGWVRGAPQDNGASFVTCKLLPGGHAVVVDLAPGIIAGETMMFPEQTIGGVWLNDGPAVYDNPKGNLAFDSLDAITASEMLRDLESLSG